MIRSLVFSVAALAAFPLESNAQTRAWTSQLGSSSIDSARGVARSADGSLFAAGYTYGALGGASAGSADALIVRYSPSGALQWSVQFGTSSNDFAMAAASDDAGGCYLAGYTSGSLAGANAGGTDAWLARVDANGLVLWTRQLGTAGADFAFSAASDGSGGVFVGGATRGQLANGTYAGADDAWVARFDASGDVAWVWQAGGALDDVARALVGDGAGGCFVAGSCGAAAFGASAGGLDAWVARLGESGQLVWSAQLGSAANDSFEGLSADGAGGVLAVGQTNGAAAAANAGAADAWIARLDGAGAMSWARQFGTAGNDVATSAAPGLLGGFYVGGKTRGALSGSYQGGWDAWTRSLDATGQQLWAEQFGSAGDDEVTSTCSDGAGGAYIVGLTAGALGGANEGSFDAFIAHYAFACGDGVAYCTSGVSSNGCVATLTSTGVARASASSSLVLSAINVDGQRAGLVFYGLDNDGFSPSPWGAGGTSYLCVKSPTQRTSVQSSGGSAGQCDGELNLDWNQFAAANPEALGAPFVGGDEVFVQAWYRDPAAPKGTSLSNAVRFRVCP